MVVARGGCRDRGPVLAGLADPRHLPPAGPRRGDRVHPQPGRHPHVATWRAPCRGDGGRLRGGHRPRRADRVPRRPARAAAGPGAGRPVAGDPGQVRKEHRRPVAAVEGRRLVHPDPQRRRAPEPARRGHIDRPEGRVRPHRRVGVHPARTQRRLEARRRSRPGGGRRPQPVPGRDGGDRAAATRPRHRHAGVRGRADLRARAHPRLLPAGRPPAHRVRHPRPDPRTGSGPGHAPRHSAEPHHRRLLPGPARRGVHRGRDGQHRARRSSACRSGSSWA